MCWCRLLGRRADALGLQHPMCKCKRRAGMLAGARPGGPCCGSACPVVSCCMVARRLRM